MSDPDISIQNLPALVMSGGGARGAYQVGVLRAIVKHFPDYTPPIITGVSAGAINAIALAARKGTFREAVEQLSDLWGNLTTDQVFKTNTLSLAYIGSKWARKLISGGHGTQRVGGLVDTQPLRELITRVAGPGTSAGEAIDANIRRNVLKSVAISATDYGTHRSVTWVQGKGVQSWERPKRISVRTQIGAEHVMASSALPLAFPATHIGGAWYGDGGIRQVAPLSPAVHLGADRILAVSTRYPRSVEEAEISAIDNFPPPAQILGVLMNAVFLDSIDRDADTLHRISELTRNLPEDKRLGLRPIDLLVIRPSQDLARLAADYELELPRSFRFLLRGLGTSETKSPDWLSMLLFEPEFLRAVMDVGEKDAENQIEAIKAFTCDYEIPEA